MSEALERLRADLDARVNPERSRRFAPERWEALRDRLFALGGEGWLGADAERVHIVGSNGKGSFAWYLARYAERAGRGPVGLYTSPHLLDWRERIRIDGAPIDGDLAWRLWQTLYEKIPDFADFTYFEALTVLACAAFRECGCALQVFEAGLGGRLDATRLARAKTLVVTRIDLEHTELLGDSHGAILREKLGAASELTTRLIFLPQFALTEAELSAAAREIVPEIAPEFYAAPPRYGGQDYLALNRYFARRLLASCNWIVEASEDPPPPPGRLEAARANIDGRSVEVVFDAAHNPAALERSLADLNRRFAATPPNERLVLFAQLHDRDPAAALPVFAAAGWPRVAVLEGPQFAPAPPGVAGAPAEDCLAWLAAEQKKEPYRALLFAGSHRIYNYFVVLTAGP